MLQLYVWKAVILDLVPNLFCSLLAAKTFLISDPETDLILLDKFCKDI